LIRPIFDEQTPTILSSTKKLEPQPKAYVSSLSSNQIAKKQENTVSNNLSRPLKSTSLKSLVKVPDDDFHPVDHETSNLTTPFNSKELIQAWDTFSEMIEEKVYLKNTMINCKPVLLDHFKFEVRVHNPAQKEELLSNSLDILKVLRTQLKNSRIQMYILVDDHIEKKTVYTSVEKFDFLNRINPLLTRLKEELDLTID
jgi:DNA polymerase-3 subunit gamma/tau